MCGGESGRYLEEAAAAAAGPAGGSLTREPGEPWVQSTEGDQNRCKKPQCLITCSLLGVQLKTGSRWKSRIRGVRSATSGRAFQNKVLLFCPRVLFNWVYVFVYLHIGHTEH